VSLALQDGTEVKELLSLRAFTWRVIPESKWLGSPPIYKAFIVNHESKKMGMSPIVVIHFQCSHFSLPMIVGGT